MNKISSIFLVIVISTTLFYSCSKNPKHNIRVKNNFTETLIDVQINTTSYGNVEIGSTTDYKIVEEDGISITASSRSGIHFALKDGVSGNKLHKFTVTFDKSGLINTSED